MRIREIDPQSEAEIELVAKRMHLTLVDVLGEQEGGSMYSHEWLVNRVRFHLDPHQSQIFIVENDQAEIIGHCIVRRETEAGAHFGLFSTTYVTPEYRRQGAAQALLTRGEAWMRAKGLREAVTYTSSSNAKLICLYQKNGYEIFLRDESRKMLGLKRSLL